MDMNSDGYVGTLQKSLAEGRVTEADIDRACRRILEAKYKLGLFENPFKYLDATRSVKEIYTPEHLAFARKAAQESMVLLKNNGVLPLSKNQRVAVVGPLAQNAAAMAGAWSMSAHNDACVTPYQGIAEVAKASYAEGSWLFKDKELEESVRYGLYKIFMPGYKAPAIHTVPQERLIAEAVAKARQADVVVACVGEIETLNGEGASRTDISIPDAQKELLKALKATGKPVVMVLVTGRPLTLTWEDDEMDAILNVWSPGSEGGHAIADVLFGDVNPSAKLTTSFPRNVGQLPLYYNHKNTGRPHPDDKPYQKFVSCYIDEVNGPLYPFGYGLSYTTYAYSPVTLSASEMPMDGSVTASPALYPRRLRHVHPPGQGTQRLPESAPGTRRIGPGRFHAHPGGPFLLQPRPPVGLRARRLRDPGRPQQPGHGRSDPPGLSAEITLWQFHRLFRNFDVQCDLQVCDIDMGSFSSGSMVESGEEFVTGLVPAGFALDMVAT